MGWQRPLYTKGIDVHKRDGVRKKLDFTREVPSARVKWTKPKLSIEGQELLAWINRRRRTTERLRELAAKSQTVQVCRRNHPLIDDSAIESDSEGGDIASRASTPDLEEVPCTPRIKRVWFNTKDPSIPRPKAKANTSASVFQPTKVTSLKIRSRPIQKKSAKSSIVKFSGISIKPASRTFARTEGWEIVPEHPASRLDWGEFVYGFEVKPISRSNKISSSVSVDIAPTKKPIVLKVDCEICGTTLNGPVQLKIHRASKKCIRKLRLKSKN